ncbi:PucR family transcriptional regulator [Anaerobacillus sp. MEB173]|uniref:PucR family transcriptional regulator n=1 Tax=Anaerobacillus sp. MEB173 TaxID=3383345 RepID=UPI003F91C686
MKEKQFERDPFKGTFGSLENLVDRISDVLKCPITIEDSNHRLLAYSSHDNQTDPARVATIIGRRVPEKVINSLWRDGVIPKLNQSDEPIRISQISDIGLGDRVAISIKKNNEMLGYIWALEIDHKLSEKELQLLKQAAQTAKNQLLHLQVRKKKKEEGHQEFFWQLLTGHIKAHNEIKKKIEQLEMIPPNPVAVIVFQFEEEITTDNERHITYMLTTTQQLRVPFHVIDRKELILLVSPNLSKELHHSINEFISDFVAQMNKRFKVSRIQGSCGNIYDKYEKIEASYQQALTVLELKNQFPHEIGHLYTYQSLGIYRYLDVILQKRQEDGFENSTLLQLIHYDKINKTQLLETLEAFLNNDSNVHDAAKELHVHTNTLNYRLKRISEITGMNLKDPNQKMTLYLEIKLNKIDQKEF